MIHDDEILSGLESSLELDRAEFTRIKKLYFESFSSGNKSATEKIIDMKQFFSFCDDPVNSEPFVDEKDTPLLWVWDNPYIINFENEFKEKLSLFRSKHIELKKHFSKIFLEENKSKSEINLKLFLSLTKSFFGINHILIPLFRALVLMYNHNSRNYELAFRELNEAENMLVYLDPSKSSKNVFSYFINLYKAYIFINLNKPIEADDALEAATRSSGLGTNAYFAKCLIHSNLSNTAKVEENLNKILLRDLDRITLAIKNQNINQFYYFLQNPTLPNIFNNNKLAISNKVINKVLSSHFDKKITFDNIELRINAINEINLVEFVDEELISKMLFLNLIFSDKNSINTVYFKLIIPVIEKIFMEIIDNLKENVKKKFYSDLYNKVADFDRRIKEFQTKKNELADELNKAKEQAQNKMQESIKLFDESIANAIAESERLLSDVDLISKYNPFEALQNSMIYNFVTSIFVFLIAILTSYLNFDYDALIKSNSLVSYLIINGVKWAGISFLVGVIISLVYSVFVFLEKLNYQQNLKRKIAQLKREKEYNIDLIRKELNKKIETLTEEYNNKISIIDKRIEELKKEKLESENSLKEKADQSMQPIMDKINFALNPKIEESASPA